MTGMPPLTVDTTTWFGPRFADVITGDRGRQRPESALMTQTLRLVDHAARLYARIGELLNECITGNFAAVPTVACLVEDCVTAVHRAGISSGALAQLGVLDASRLPTQADLDDVKDMRDVVQHIDDRLLRRRRPHNVLGQPAMVRVDADTALLGSHSIEWTTLTRTIEALFDAASNPLR